MYHRINAAFIVLFLSGCQLPTQPATNTLDCASGTHEDPNTHTCVANAAGQGAVTITITPGNDPRCPNFSPNPASVPVGRSFNFKNSTTVSATILGYPNSPWVTVGAGATSSTLSFNSSGVNHFGTQACRDLLRGDYTWYYGVINATVG